MYHLFRVISSIQLTEGHVANTVKICNIVDLSYSPEVFKFRQPTTGNLIFWEVDIFVPINITSYIFEKTQLYNSFVFFIPLFSVKKSNLLFPGDLIYK